MKDRLNPYAEAIVIRTPDDYLNLSFHPQAIIAQQRLTAYKRECAHCLTQIIAGVKTIPKP